MARNHETEGRMAATTPARKVTIQVLFDGPGPQVNGLAADADGLWLCDQKDNRIYKVRYDGSVVNETNTGNVYELDLRDGTVVDHWQVDGFEAHGMTMTPDGRIWFCDATTNKIGIVAG